jgi:CBS domain-containing protein
VPIEQLGVERGSFLERLMMVNLFLAAFNMLPAFPMDGGRVLRAILARRMEYARATHVAANVGQGMAFLFGFMGLFGNPMLLFIALFVWIGAAQEATTVQMKSALGGIPVARAMLTDFRTLQPGDTLARAAELILAGSQHDFPVVDGGRVIGVLTRADLIGALSAQNTRKPVADVMQREFLVADSNEMLEGALERLQACACHTLPVMRDGQLVGLVTMDNIGEFVLIHAALSGKQAPRIPLSAEG